MHSQSPTSGALTVNEIFNAHLFVGVMALAGLLAARLDNELTY